VKEAEQRPFDTFVRTTDAEQAPFFFTRFLTIPSPRLFPEHVGVTLTLYLQLDVHGFCYDTLSSCAAPQPTLPSLLARRARLADVAALPPWASPLIERDLGPGGLLPTPSMGLPELTRAWCRGWLSNLDYLLALNHAAGRREHDPNNHPVVPWVINFQADSPAAGWRDLGYTKYRLNKGDEQLDIAWQSVVPHHVSDVLSELTYYVYLARQTPVALLQRFVRSQWVPNEYPSTMARLYAFTPDECIPEFYTDPAIFRSIHDDLGDLGLPSWARTPEEFVRVHRLLLESDIVSAALHHWIDLTFGHKLVGNAAKAAKNVTFALADGRRHLTNHGVVRLFDQPHPHRIVVARETLEELLLMEFERAEAEAEAGKATERADMQEQVAEEVAALAEDASQQPFQGAMLVPKATPGDPSATPKRKHSTSSDNGNGTHLSEAGFGTEPPSPSSLAKKEGALGGETSSSPTSVANKTRGPDSESAGQSSLSAALQRIGAPIYLPELSEPVRCCVYHVWTALLAVSGPSQAQPLPLPMSG
jgi:hypothetical protein